MPLRVQTAFAALVAVQASHSVEEYVTRLYQTFAPARFVSGLASTDLRTGFLIVNVSIVLFGLWCALVPVRRGWAGAVALAWSWTIVEGLNGFGHLMIATASHGYFSGAATAPLLLTCSFWLSWRLLEYDEARRRPRGCAAR